LIDAGHDITREDPVEEGHNRDPEKHSQQFVISYGSHHGQQVTEKITSPRIPFQKSSFDPAHCARFPPEDCFVRRDTTLLVSAERWCLLPMSVCYVGRAWSQVGLSNPGTKAVDVEGILTFYG